MPEVQARPRIIDNPVKDRTEIRVGTGLPGNAAVHEIEDCREQEEESPVRNWCMKNRTAHAIPGREAANPWLRYVKLFYLFTIPRFSVS